MAGSSTPSRTIVSISRSEYGRSSLLAVDPQMQTARILSPCFSMILEDNRFATSRRTSWVCFSNLTLDSCETIVFDPFRPQDDFMDFRDQDSGRSFKRPEICAPMMMKNPLKPLHIQSDRAING